jgi:hypothetical protein
MGRSRGNTGREAEGRGAEEGEQGKQQGEEQREEEQRKQQGEEPREEEQGKQKGEQQPPQALSGCSHLHPLQSPQN